MPDVSFNGILPLINYSAVKPQEWSPSQAISNMFDLQTFSNSLQNIIKPETSTFDPTKYGLTDYADLFSKNIKPLSLLNDLKAGLALSGSDDPMTLLFGKLKTNNTVAEATKPLNLSKGGVKESFGDKFNKSTFGKNFGLWSAGINAANSLFTGIAGEKAEYNGPKGGITRGLDGAYDKILSTISMVPGFGLAASLIMGANKLLGNVANKLGAGTDGFTTADAILGSSFMLLTPFGLINGFGGKKTDTITKNDEVFALVGSNYGGSNAMVDDALNYSGKKYGLLSSGARKDANALIANARRLQNILEDVSDEANTRRDLLAGMSAILGNRRAFNMQGGYDLSSVRVGRNGLSLSTIAKRVANTYKFKLKHKDLVIEDVFEDIPNYSYISEITLDSILPKYLEGGEVIDPFEVYFKSLPKNLKDTIKFRVKDYWEFNGRSKDFDEAVSRGMFTLDRNGIYHAKSIAENPQTGEIEYMKHENHPTRHMESDWYEKGLVYNDDGSITQLKEGMDGYNEWQLFRNNYELLKTSPYWKYVRRKDTNSPLSNYIKEVDLSKYLEGGKMNIIPEGALHARLHHMENADNLTKKGIPVVSEGENGELLQQCEIERNEIIFRLEVTKKLEELAKDGSDEAAIEAGKLLVNEILFNTLDNTGLINEIN